MSTRPTIFVINLDSEVQRRRSMTARLAELGLETTWIQAVDGRGELGASMSNRADMARAEKVYGTLVPAEIACALSHLAVYRAMVAGNIPYALVLEDDMALDADVPALIEALGPSSILTHLPPGSASVVHFSFVKRARRFGGARLGHRRLSRTVGSAWATGSYLLTLEAAKRLAATRDPVWTVADHWEAIAKDAKLTLWCVSPACARETAEGAASSSISIAGKQRRVAPPQTLSTRVKRLVYRSVIRPLTTREIPRGE